MIEKKGKICYRCMEIHEADSSKCPACGFDITNPHIYPCKEKRDTLPAGSILSNHYLVGCVILNDYFEIIYAGLDLYMEQKVFIHEFFPAEIVSRNTENDFVSVISQEDKAIFQKGKELYQERFRRIKAKIPYSEQILDFHEDNGTSYMIGKAYAFVSLKDMLHHKPFSRCQAEYFSILHALKDYLEALDAEGEQYYDIVPERIIVGEGQVVILAGGKEKYQFAENFSSKLIALDKKYCPPGLPAEGIFNTKITDIYNFSLLCYYVIASRTVPEAETHHKSENVFHKKRLMTAVKKYNIPSILLDSIVTGITENPDKRYNDYSGYAVLDEYTSPPTELFFLQSNLQDDKGKEKNKKILLLKIVVSGLAGIILFSSIFYFLIGTKNSMKNIEKDMEDCTPLPTAIIKPSPSSLPTISPTPIPTIVPTPIPTGRPTPIPTIKPTLKPTKKPKAIRIATPKPVKRPIHTKRPIPKPTPIATDRPTETTVRPKATPKAAVKATKKPLQKPFLKDKEEQIEGID